MTLAVNNPFVPGYIVSPTGSGSVQTTNMAVVPHMRKNEIEFISNNLNPYKQAHFFFENVLVDRFVQNPSVLVLDGLGSNTANSWNQGDLLYCNTTHALASVITYSGANTLYLNDNYVCVNVTPVGSNTLDSTYFYSGDVVTQYIQNYYNFATGNTFDTSNGYYTRAFSGRVEYFNPTDGVIALTPIDGTLTFGTNANTMLYNNDMARNKVVNPINQVAGNRFPVSSVVTNLTTPFQSYTAPSNNYIAYSGAVQYTATNVVELQSNVSSNTIGQYIYLTSGNNYGQISQITGIATDNVTLTLSDPLYPMTNTTYSIGSMSVDQYGVLAGIFNLPEAQNMAFLSGAGLFTIIDSTVVNDPSATMKASAVYYVGGSIPTTSGATPVITPDTVLPGGIPLIAPVSPTSSGSVPTPTILVDTSSAGLPPGQVDTTTTNPSSPIVYPLAQTFTTPPPSTKTTNYGIFATSVDLWFSNKPTGNQPQFPVIVRLVTVENGVPTSNIIASSIMQCSDIVTCNAATIDSANIGANIDFNLTVNKFEFSDPVYLLPSTEYAIVVYAESPYYDIWTSEVGTVDITSGQTNRLVSQLPNVGSFFKSQNSSQWTPIQNYSMMFVLNKAAFNPNPVTWNFNINPVSTDSPIAFQDITLYSSDVTYPTTSLTYKIQPVYYQTATESYIPDPLLTQLSVGKNYNFGSDLNISAINGKNRFVLGGNANSMILQVDAQSLNPDVSPMFNSEMLGAVVGTNVINNGGIQNNNISIVSPGMHLNASNITVTFSSPQLSTGTTAFANVINGGLDVVTGNLRAINMQSFGSGYVQTPTVTIKEANLSLSVANSSGTGSLATVRWSPPLAFPPPVGMNVVVSGTTNYDGTHTITAASNSTVSFASSSTGGTTGGTIVFVPVNATATVAGEDQASGGNAIARYQTRQIVLADGFDSGDLRVWLDGVIPVGTSAQVYYKVMSKNDADFFINKKWQLMTPVNSSNSPDQKTIVEIEYAPSPLVGGKPSGSLSYTQDGVKYPLGGTFKYFAIKIVLLAADPTVSPVITGMRAIAYPAG